MTIIEPWQSPRSKQEGAEPTAAMRIEVPDPPPSYQKRRVVNLLIVELPTEMIDLGTESPRDDAFVYEHFLYFQSKSDQLPGILIRVREGRAEVLRGEIFAHGARDLGRTIRSIVDTGASDESLRGFLENPEVRSLDVAEVDDEGPVWTAWQVFVFDRPLNDAEKRAFVEQICGFFEDLGVATEPVSSLRFDDAACRAEFKALVPAGENERFSDFFGRCHRFSDDFVPIVSYQGRRFDGYRMGR